MTRVMTARATGIRAGEHQNVAALGHAEGELRGAVGSLCGRGGVSGPQSQRDFLHLQSRISGLENAIADRREFYNESVTINNVRIEQFPDRSSRRCSRSRLSRCSGSRSARPPTSVSRRCSRREPASVRAAR